jgi:3-oxoacyl-[acyl-carrier protein] reductase
MLLCYLKVTVTFRYKVTKINNYTIALQLKHQIDKMSKLKNKVAIVTGASKGIGASIAKHFAAAGAKVVVNYASSKDGADKVVKEIADNGGTAIPVHADVSREPDVIKLFTETINAFGTVDILVNNAGIYHYAPIEEVTAESIQQHFNINVMGSILAIREAVKLFGDKGGNIINISSGASNTPLATGSVYSATKAALDAVTIALSKELGVKKIRINSILPGAVETEGTHSTGIIGSEFETKLIANTPLGRFGQPEDIAKVAVFLASDDSAWITGEKITVSGGIYGL